MTQASLPYPGLRAFARGESHLFFGREGSVDSMIDQLAATRFLAVLGASGSGKSSLVRTGLLDGLELGFYAKAGARWTVVDLHPGGQPMRNLASGLAAVSLADPQPMDVEVLRALVARGPRSITDWCLAGGLKSGHNLLLLVDQFEELFRYGDYAAREEAEAFIALLLESARAGEVPIYVVLTMRSEYLGACSLIQGLAEQINMGFYLTPRMNREECRLAIEGPASVSGFSIQPALVNQLLNDMASFAPWEEQSGIQQSQILSRRADQLPLMQHLLNRLWLRAQARASGAAMILTLDDYRAVGGLAGALDAHGAEVVASLSPDDHADIEMIFRTLISGPDPTNAVRRPCRFAELAAEAKGGPTAARRIVDVFRAADCNFLQPNAGVSLDDDIVVDISHESLIRQWGVLAEWLRNEARASANWRRLLMGAERRNAGEGGLLTGLDLDSLAGWWKIEQPTSLWAARHGGRYEEAETYLADSREADAAGRKAAQARATKERTLLWRGVAILTVFLVICVALIINAFFNKARSEEDQIALKLSNDKLQLSLEQTEEAWKKAAWAGTQARERENNAKFARDIAQAAEKRARGDAQSYSQLIEDLSGILYSEKYKNLLGVGALQKDLGDHMLPSLQRIEKTYSGVVSPAATAQVRFFRAQTLDILGDAGAAADLRRDAFRAGLKALKRLRPGNAEYDDLAQITLLLSYLYGWSLFDGGEDDTGDNVLAQVDTIARRYNYATAPPALILPLVQHEWLQARRSGDLGKDDRRAEHIARAKLLAKRSDAPPKDQRRLDHMRSMFSAETLKEGNAGTQSGIRTCDLGERLYRENPADRVSVIELVSCQIKVAEEIKGDVTEADRLMGEAEHTLEEALRVEPHGVELLLAKSELLLAKASLYQLREIKDKYAYYQFIAGETFVQALEGRSVLQRATSQVKDIYKKFSDLEFTDIKGQADQSGGRDIAPGVKKAVGQVDIKNEGIESNRKEKDESTNYSKTQAIKFYEKIRLAVRENRIKFRYAPAYAYVDGAAATKIAELLINDMRPAEAEQMVTAAISAFTEGKILERVTSASEDPATVCSAWSMKVQLLTESRRVNEAVGTYEDMIRRCGPALKKYPWDFYLRSYLKRAAIHVGKLLYWEKRFAEALPLLQYTSDWGVKESSKLLADIYRHGQSVPVDAERAAKLLALAGRQSMKRFTVPTEFSGVKFPFPVYVQEYAPDVGFDGIDDQATWVKEMRGGNIPEEVILAFRRLHKIARDNNVSFPDLTVYAIGTVENDNESQSKDEKQPMK